MKALLVKLGPIVSIKSLPPYGIFIPVIRPLLILRLNSLSVRDLANAPLHLFCLPLASSPSILSNGHRDILFAKKYLSPSGMSFNTSVTIFISFNSKSA